MGISEVKKAEITVWMGTHGREAMRYAQNVGLLGVPIVHLPRHQQLAVIGELALERDRAAIAAETATSALAALRQRVFEASQQPRLRRLVAAWKGAPLVETPAPAAASSGGEERPAHEKTGDAA